MEEVNLSEKNEILLNLLSKILKASAIILHNRARLKAFDAQGITKNYQRQINEYLNVKKEMESALVEGAAVFEEHLKDDDGVYGWGELNLSLMLIKKLSQGDIGNGNLISIIEHRSKFLEKIVMINCFEILNRPTSHDEESS